MKILIEYSSPNCRYALFKKLESDIGNSEAGGLNAFTTSYNSYGINVKPDGTIICREWCPGAKALYLWGDFSELYWPNRLHLSVPC